ncbi:LiaF domain-containing protein [Shewanella sp. UCD-KL12]|uniref:LiaF domain-containing protein n=1 Tax=Shewanella sp. UCD-KL12 TaxID=1917163 RepID=UPI000970BCFD|nr:LiaF domain-containing protein [Shewanella sp. UCD-KL12]
MSVTLEDRPIEQVREEVIDKLIVNYSHGMISVEAFERRLDDAMDSSSHEELMSLVADLPLSADADYSKQKDKQFTPNYSSKQSEDTLNINCILSSNERSGQWEVPSKIKLSNVLGETTLDFTDAIFQYQNVTINLNCVLGSCTIYIPENINVVCKTYCAVSSIENRAPSMANRQAPVITIEGKVILGDLSVSVKRTIKEKFIAFANQLKDTFS